MGRRFSKPFSAYGYYSFSAEPFLYTMSISEFLNLKFEFVSKRLTFSLIENENSNYMYLENG